MVVEELQVKERNLESVQRRVEESTKEVDAKHGELGSLQKSIEEQSHELVFKGKEIERVTSLLSSSSSKIHMRETELPNKMKEKNICSSELKEKESELCKAKDVIKKFNAERETTEKQLSSMVEEVQGKQQLLDFISNTLEFNRGEISAKEKELSSLENEVSSQFIKAIISSCAGAIVCDSSSPDSRLYQPSQPCLTDSEVSIGLRFSSDPVGMVFDLLKQSFSRPGVVDETVVRSRVILLEQLMVVSRTVKPEVKEAAIELAVTWRGKLAREGHCCSMDALAFLLFLVAFGISSCYKADDLIELVSMIGHYEKAPELCRYLGLAKNIPELILSLCKKNMHMEAIRFSVAFNMVKDFPPDTILSDHLKKARIFEDGKKLLESQHQALNTHLDSLKALSQDVVGLGHNPSFIVNEMSHHLKDLEIRLGKKTTCLIAAGLVIKNPRPHGGGPNHLSGANATVSAGHNWVWQQVNFSGEEGKFKRQKRY
ncbi:FRIGIDA-like protein 2 [Linum perenne]